MAFRIPIVLNMLIELFGAFVGSILLVYFGIWCKRHLELVASLRHIPGPKAYPFIGSAYPFIFMKREERFFFKYNLHTQFPEIMCQWFGLVGQVSLKRAEHLGNILFTSNQHLQKGWTYDFYRPWLGGGLLTTSGDRWHQKRKMLTPAFHFGILGRFCEVFAVKADVLVGKLETVSDSGESFQIYPFITRVSLDVIAEAAMGTKINAQDHHDNEYVSTVYEASEMFVRRIFSPWYMFELVYNSSSEGKRFAKIVKKMRDFTKQVIADRRKTRQQIKVADSLSEKQRPAFLDILLDEFEKDDTQLTENDIIEEVQTLMFAGHDTISSSVAWVVYMIGRHHDIQEEVFAEIQSIFHGTKRQATVSDLQEMHLLDRVIKETLRLRPPAAFIQRKLSEDVQIDSQYCLPKGCEVCIEISILHRDPRYFPDPERFDPNRFLPVNVSKRPLLSYIPFSAGPRNCIGFRFAMYELKMLLSTLVRNYRFKGVGKEELPIEEIITKPFYGVNVICEKRK